MGLMGGVDGNNLQCALIHFIIIHVHEYNTTVHTTYSVDVECRALYRVRIHYAQRKIYKHHVSECTTTHNLFLVHLYV